MERYSGMIFHGYNAIQREAVIGGANLEDLSFGQIKFFASKVEHFSAGLKSSIASATSQNEIVSLLSNSDGAPLDFTEGELTARGQSREDYNMRVGQSKLRSGKFMANLSLPIGSNGSEIHAFGGLSYRKGMLPVFIDYPTNKGLTQM